MKIVSIILARGGSKGISNKNTMMVAGKPLVAWSIEQSLACKLIDKSYVSSDSDNILRLAKDYGAKPIKRPDELATDESTSEEALIHALKVIGEVDLVVFLQPTSPIRNSFDLTFAISTLTQNNFDSLFTASILKDECVWEWNEDKFVSVNYDYKNRKRRQDKKMQYLENGSIYVFKPEILFKYNNRLGGRIGISVMESWKSHEIDNLDDVEICEYYLNKLKKLEENE